jgi:hypothetical protein
MNLGHFDTILAFAAAMAGFSLVVTALTQAISALFGPTQGDRGGKGGGMTPFESSFAVADKS